MYHCTLKGGAVIQQICKQSMFAEDLSPSSIGRRGHLAASRRAARRAGYPGTRPRLPAARFAFLQLLGVQQRHRSPPRLDWRRKQRRPRAARSPRSFAAAPSRLPSQETAKTDHYQVDWSNPDRPSPIGRTPGPKGWTANEIPSTPCAAAGRRPLLREPPRSAETRSADDGGGFCLRRAATPTWARRSCCH
jgi:hypothetical protein